MFDILRLTTTNMKKKILYTCHCHKMYKVEAVGLSLSLSNYTFKGALDK